MIESLQNRNCRVLIALGLYLLYETIDKIIDSDYKLKASSNNKSIILQKQALE